MNATEAREYIFNLVDSVDYLTACEASKMWASNARVFIYDMEKSGANDMPTIIFDNGYTRGIEVALFMNDEKPFTKEETMIQCACAWRALVDAYMERVGVKKHAFE